TAALFVHHLIGRWRISIDSRGGLVVARFAKHPGRTIEDVPIERDRCLDARASREGESHISQVMSINTADVTVSAPVFDWLKSVD
ncbi:MAG: hypothetical protein KGO48_11320, partial [Alphaproteobacteria bacterium]|nr:hypothetical protein [Alphaproteobacteria bacterium]